MAWWQLFTGGGKVAETAVETIQTAVHGVIDGVDKLIWTDEERAQASQKITDTWLKAVAATASESSTRSITRRLLAVMVMGSFLLLLLSGAFLFKVDPNWSEYLLRCAGQLSSLVMSISIFYFGYYAVNSVISTVKSKKT